MRFGRVLLLVLLCAAPADAAPADEALPAATISYTQIAQLPPSAVTQRLADQIADLLYGAPWPRPANWMDQTQVWLRLSLARTMTGDKNASADRLSADIIRALLPRLATLLPPDPLQAFDGDADGELGTTLSLWMKARASGTRGMCAQDLLQLTLSPTGRHVDTDTPLHVAGFDVTSFFFYAGRPLGPIAQALPDAERAAAEQACVRVAEGPRLVVPFNGPSEAEAVRAAWLLRQARIGLARGTFPLDCTRFQTTSEPGCRADMAKVIARELFVNACAPGARTCALQIIDDHYHQVVTLTLDGGDRPRIEKLAIWSDHGITFVD